MNTCIVCGGSFQPQSNCPYCNFPEITVLGDKAVLDEMAAGYRKDYLADIRLGVMYTMWKADGDTLTADREGCELFADGSAVQGADIWCDRQLARQPDGDRVDVRLVVEKAGQRRIIPVSVPNLKQPRLQQIGLRLCEKLHVRVLLRNGVQEALSSNLNTRTIMWRQKRCLLRKARLYRAFLLPKRRFVSVPKRRCKIAVFPLWIDLNSRKVNIRYTGQIESKNLSAFLLP